MDGVPTQKALKNETVTYYKPSEVHDTVERKLGKKYKNR